MRILALETSCDETSAAVLSGSASAPTRRVMASSVGQVSTLLGEVSTAAQEQQQGVSQVNEAVLNLQVKSELWVTLGQVRQRWCHPMLGDR